MDKVSIVVPIYNTEKYLDECIESIINQTYKNLEIILVNDGSKDKSPQICNEWAIKDNRIIVIHKLNEGAGISRNRGIEISTGNYILFVDSDDYIAPTLVEKCLNAISKSPSAMVMFGTTNINECGEIINKQTHYTNKYIFERDEIQKELLPELLFSKNLQTQDIRIYTCMANFYSLDIIKKTNWKFKSEKEYLSEDLFSIISLMPYITKFVIIDEPLYYYRHGHESLSSSSRLNDYEMIKKFYKQCIELCEKYNFNGNVQKSMSEPYLSFTITCLKSKIRQKKPFTEKYKEINAILKDELLHKLLNERKLREEKISRHLLFAAIKSKNYLLTWLLIYLQAHKD